MKYLLLLLFFLNISLVSIAQPDEIKRIMAKEKAGEDLTEAEEATMEKWFDEMDKKMEQQSNSNGKQGSANLGVKKSGCPPAAKVPFKVVDLTRDSYIAMAKGLMAVYGPKSGDLPGLKKLLETSEKPTDGADMGAIFRMAGAGSASIYAASWSATQKPGDILTANNLGVALKDMGEFSKAIQVLRYADKLKPNIALIIINMGWVYREMGYPVLAKQMFEKALKVAPEMTSPYLGLGLIAKCEGNNIKAEEYLRKALADNYSAAGIAAYKQAKAAQPPKKSGEQEKPLTPEKGDAGEVNVPEMPVYEQMERTASQQQQVQNYMNRIDSRMQRLLNEYNSALAVVKKQQEKALKDPGNSMVFRRDFAMELMQFQDVTELLFGENSNYGKAITNGGKLLEQNSAFIEKDLPSIQQNLEKSIRLLEQMTKLIGDMAACGDNKICQAKVQQQINAVQYEMDQLEYQSCVLQKGEMENTFSATCKAYKAEYTALKEAVSDYYAYTNPILEKIYSPSFNELQNLYREMLVLAHEKAVVGMGSGLPEMANQYNELKCVEPKPPDPPEADPDDSKLPKKKEKDCPLGKDGIKMGIGALSFELGCDHVKLSGGEGLLWSISRDFEKHETKIGVGVGAKGEYGNGNLSVEATVMVEVTIGQGDVIKDVELTSSVKAGLGGLVEGEVGGRISLEGGPELTSDGGFIMPDIPGMGE